MSSIDVFEKFFTEAEERQLLRAVKRVDDIFAKRDYWWMELLRATSIRVSALAGLTVWDARQALQNGQLHLRRELVKGQRAAHNIPLNRRAIAALKALIKIHNQMVKAWPDAPADLPLVLSRQHRGLSVRSFQARMSMWIVEAGLQEGTPHTWRHTWAKRAMKNSTSPAKALQSVQRILGHQHVQTTTIYTRPDKEDLEQIMRDSE